MVDKSEILEASKRYEASDAQSAMKMERAFRVLTTFIRLQQGKKLKKSDLVKEYNAQPKSIQRDISLLNEILGEKYPEAEAVKIAKDGYSWQFKNEQFK